MEKETALTPCCKKPLVRMASGLYVICWSPGNGVVQCHACGWVYVPSPDGADPVTDVWAPVSPVAQAMVETVAIARDVLESQNKDQ